MPVNVNPKTGIRYGVVDLQSLEDWVFEEFFHNGRNLTYEAAQRDFADEIMSEHGRPPTDEEWDEWNDYAEFEEEEYELEIDDMKLLLTYLGGAPLVFVMDSPHVTRTRGTSPCVPNAGDLDNKDPRGIETYDVPEDWYYKE